jgi:hypothetical protein
MPAPRFQTMTIMKATMTRVLRVSDMDALRAFEGRAVSQDGAPVSVRAW